MAKGLVIIGIILIVAGLSWNFLSKMNFWGRLPGDILIQKKNFTFYFPLATSILVSIILSLVWGFFKK